MAVRDDFEIHAELRFERDNPAAEAILFVLEDEFGKPFVRHWQDDDSGELRARIRCDARPMDARRANWLHEQLGVLSKYLLAPADVQCADAVDGDRSVRLDPGRPAPAPPAAADEAPGTTATIEEPSDQADTADACADDTG